MFQDILDFHVFYIVPLCMHDFKFPIHSKYRSSNGRYANNVRSSHSAEVSK